MSINHPLGFFYWHPLEGAGKNTYIFWDFFVESSQPRYATDDAVRVGRLHVDTDGWEEVGMVGRLVVEGSILLLNLEDHPRTGKWLVTMGSFRPLSRVVPLTNGLSMAYKWVIGPSSK